MPLTWQVQAEERISCCWNTNTLGIFPWRNTSFFFALVTQKIFHKTINCNVLRPRVVSEPSCCGSASWASYSSIKNQDKDVDEVFTFPGHVSLSILLSYLDGFLHHSMSSLIEETISTDPKWVLGTKVRSSARTECAGNHFSASNFILITILVRRQRNGFYCDIFTYVSVFFSYLSPILISSSHPLGSFPPTNSYSCFQQAHKLLTILHHKLSSGQITHE